MAIKKLSAETLRQQKGISFPGITTCFFCYSRQGELFMGRRSHNARDEHDRWENGGGGLKWGSTVEANIRREIKEEYNATALKLEFLGYRDVFRTLEDGTPTHWVGLDYAVLVDPSEIKINEPDMFDDSGWFRLDNLPTPLHSQFEPAVKKYYPRLSQILKNRYAAS
ncbi:MAG TPA: NUDIX domain-containing protein [Candidatus Saccharimonadales bacterium]|nr:NUDIX domain-containing protein [Candidatus Saccharimonadales bacterium]